MNINKPQGPLANKPTRLLSIDALRGFDMFWILGAEGLFAALFTLTGWSFFQVAAKQMLHSQWHGFTAYDLIFPLFIFLSGVSIGIAAKPIGSYSKIQVRQKHLHAFKRVVLLLTLGVIYNHGWGVGIPASFDDIRFASVLGRIGIAWYIAMLLVWYTSNKVQWLVATIILLGYWMLLSYVSIGGYGAGDFSSTGALNVWFDQTLLPGATYRSEPLDPEGILSNLTSIVNALAGVFVGRYLILHRQQEKLLIGRFLAVSVVLIFAGYLWGEIFPINKSLWTSSFVLVTCGYSLLLLTFFYWLIDVIKLQRWAIFFAVIGTNSIIVYLGTSLINWQYTSESLMGAFIHASPIAWHELLKILALLSVQWLVLAWLYRRKIFIKV